jgi:capsular polysaccharide biosynthesis protein
MNNNYYENLKRNWKLVCYLAFFGAIAIFDISLFLPTKYESEVSVIVIQKQTSDDVDAFSATKSAEYLSGILSKAIYTDVFLSDVLQSSFDIQKTFSIDDEDKKKEWEKTVKTKRINNTGIINVIVSDKSKAEAEKIAKAIAWNLSENGKNYHGGGDRVEIKLIDGPITPQALLGALAAIVIVWIFPESRIVKKNIDKPYFQK